MKKTIFKQGQSKESPYHLLCVDNLSALENGSELLAIIEEYQDQLLPCIHCGHKYPRISYCYRPGDKYPDKMLPTGELTMLEAPHGVYAVCSRRSIFRPSGEQGCNIRTQEWHAEDDETDFREALSWIVAAWNRRPDDKP